LVVACNTASVVALSALREAFDLPFVGVVPAVKPAAALSKAKRIGLLATNGTVSDSYTEGLINDFASSCAVTRIGDGSIVEFIEGRYFDADESARREALAGAIDRIRGAEIDTLVIGCTHFVYIVDDLRKALLNRVKIVDSRDGVGRQILRVVDQVGRSSDDSPDSVLFTTANGDEQRFSEYADRFGLRYAGVLGG
jgi:glutamate racemase